MRTLLFAVLAALAVLPLAASAAGDPDLAALRQQVEQMRTDYEARIRQLEQRLDHAERSAAAAHAAATDAGKRADDAQRLAQAADTSAEQAQSDAADAQQASEDAATAPTSGFADAVNRFNPAISMVLQGTATRYANNPDDWRLPGFQLGDETGRKPQGLSLDESEITVSANVDDWFYGQSTLSFAQDNGSSSVDVEEAYVDTLSLPYGFGARIGRFYSDVAFQNPVHSHAWDFTDAPLAYDAFLGSQYGDDGLRVNWVAPTNLLLEFGIEAYHGNRFPGGDSRHSDSPLGGAHSAFVHLGGDFDDSNSWKLGLSHLRVQPRDRQSQNGGADTSFDGDSKLTVASAVWKWAPDGNTTQRNLTLEGEFFYRDESGDVGFDQNGDQATIRYHGPQQGAYIQGAYQFMPRWRAGLRYDRLWANNKLDVTSNSGTLSDRQVLDASGLVDDHDPQRFTVMLDYSHSEFSRLRLQYEYDQSTPDTDQVWMLQYIMTLGAHGAHSY